jgi:ribosomal protein S27AE
MENDKKVICANKKCPNYSDSAVLKKYPSSVYCSLRCKYADEDNSHNERYGD